jgi:ABC-type transporter lipoprotein component MlaA
MDTVNNFENRVLRGKAKAMIVKIKRGTVERPPMPEVPTGGAAEVKTTSETEEELMIRLISSGVKGNMDEINNLENRVLRGKIKAAIVKEKRKNK